jgi:hypothetical protein
MQENLGGRILWDVYRRWNSDFRFDTNNELDIKKEIAS